LLDELYILRFDTNVTREHILTMHGRSS